MKRQDFFVALIICTAVSIFSSLTFTTVAESFEITPFGGTRVGGEVEDYFTGAKLELDDDSVVGLALNFDTAPGGQIEVRYSHQETFVEASPSSAKLPLDVDYLHVGGLLSFKNHTEFNPFVAASIGAAIFSPENYDSESKFSFSLGGGAKYFFNDRFGVRLEGRGYWTFFESNEAVFCHNGVCRVYVEGDVLGQFEATAGLIFKF